MGSGKSTIGRMLAEELGMNFVDTDEELVERTGVAISVIFDTEGEKGFRQREAKLISELSALEGSVIATGGGAVLLPENRSCLRESGLVVYLQADIEVLYERTKNSKTRPLLVGQDIRKKLSEILQQRGSLYLETAHLTVKTGKMNARRMTVKIVSKVREQNQ